MKYFITVIAALLSCVEGAPSDCGQTFQAQLQDLLSLKGSCANAGFRDCCQVKQLKIIAVTGQHNSIYDRYYVTITLYPFSLMCIH